MEPKYNHDACSCRVCFEATPTDSGEHLWEVAYCLNEHDDKEAGVGAEEDQEVFMILVAEAVVNEGTMVVK